MPVALRIFRREIHGFALASPGRESAPIYLLEWAGMLETRAEEIAAFVASMNEDVTCSDLQSKHAGNAISAGPAGFAPAALVAAPSEDKKSQAMGASRARQHAVPHSRADASPT